MNECADRDIKELLPDVLHRTLGSDDRERVELHLATCDSCREELSVLRMVNSAAVFAPAIDVGRIVRQIPPYQRISPTVEAPARSRVTQWLVATAAAAVLVVGGSLVVNRQPSGEITIVATDTSTGLGAGPAAPIRTSVDRPAAAGGTTRTPAHTLALASDVAGLSDGDLVQLMNEMDDFDALPASEPEPVIAVDNGDSL
jgi:anti-sigma factor RsiW